MLNVRALLLLCLWGTDALAGLVTCEYKLRKNMSIYDLSNTVQHIIITVYYACVGTVPKQWLLITKGVTKIKINWNLAV